MHTHLNQSKPSLKHWMIKDFSVLLYANERPFCGIIITVLQSSSVSAKIAHSKAREREELSALMTAIKSPLYVRENAQFYRSFKNKCVEEICSQACSKHVHLT